MTMNHMLELLTPAEISQRLDAMVVTLDDLSKRLESAKQAELARLALIEEEAKQECYRCGAKEENEEDWRAEDQTHPDVDGEVFCDTCFSDKDKYGNPYRSDQAEMIANESNYLPRGF